LARTRPLETKWVHYGPGWKGEKKSQAQQHAGKKKKWGRKTTVGRSPEKATSFRIRQVGKKLACDEKKRVIKGEGPNSEKSKLLRVAK